MAEWWASPEMAGVEAEKGKLSAAAELAWGVERKADPSQAPQGAFDYWFSPALYRKKWGLNRSGVLMNFVQRDNIRGYKCIKLRVGNLRPLQRRSPNPPCVRHCGRRTRDPKRVMPPPAESVGESQQVPRAPNGGPGATGRAVRSRKPLKNC